MTAKQTGQTEALFVRIPAVLKQQLAASARAKRVPLTQEVTYRLSQPPSALVTVSQLQLQHLETTAVLLRQQLSAIEEFLKRISNSPLAKRSKLLRNLSTMMDESRVRREQDAEALRKRFAREEAEQAAKKAPALARIDPVWIPKPTEVTEMKERRRRNLLLHLDGRPRGARAELAIALKCEPSQISQLLSVPGAAGHRGIGRELARRLEVHLALPAEALDRPETPIQKVLNDVTYLGKILKRPSPVKLRRRSS